MKFDVDCPADGTCLLWIKGGDTTTYTDGAFSPHTPPDPDYLLDSASCGTPTFCVALAGPDAVIGT